MTDISALLGSGGMGRPNPEEQRKRWEKGKERARKQFSFIYEQLLSLTDDQLKALWIISTILSYESDSAEMASFYNGTINGLLFQRCAEAGEDFLIFADDVFKSDGDDEDSEDAGEQPLPPRGGGQYL